MPSPTLTIFTTMALAESEEDLVRRPPGGTRVLSARACADAAAARRAFDEADIVFGNPPVEWLRTATRLRWVQLESVGIDAYRADAGAEWTRRIVVSNLQGFFGTPVAETLVAGVLALRRGLVPLLQAQAGARWVREAVRPQLDTVEGGHAVILGAGSIGRHVQQILGGLGATSQLYARTAPDAALRTPAELDAALPRADFVFGCLPDTPETRGLLSRERLALLPRHALVANGGRGSLIDEAALAEALHRGKLGGAVLDVTAVEPLPPGHALWTSPSIVLTQHTGGGFADEVSAKTDFFHQNFARYLAGTPVKNIVDFAQP